ncbi:uncharacterized protein LOC111874734 isoform X3 [Cryptotermes secundus]|nr:uncharacterized protein LOC111874734 isoform X3 [Cryptotermes secundus]
MTTFKIWGTCRFLAVLLVLLLCQETVQTKLPSSDETAVRALKCIFWTDPVRTCVDSTGYVLPNRLMQMYENMNEEMKESIRAGRLETMTPEDFAKLPTSFFLLISSHHLISISGSSLAALLISSQDVAVAVKIMENLNTGMLEEFFKKLQGVELKSQIQDIIANTLVKLLPDANSSWNYHRFRTIEKVGSPLLAHLPSYFLANLTKLESSKFLFHLRNWLWSNLPSNVWCGKTEASKRAWTDLMLRSSYPFNLSEWNANDVRRYFLEGATPDELQHLSAQQLENTVLLKTKLSRLQVQAIFNILYSNRELSSANLTEAQLLPVALQLSPANLLRFSVASTDFRVLSSLFEQMKFCSYITAKQVMESLIAQSLLSGRLKSVEPETWGNGIEHLGKFVYVLPVSALESYRLSPPTALVQSSIDCDRITARQARLLTGDTVINLEKPDLIMGQKGLLRALSSSQLVSARTLPQNLLYHLLVSLPSGMPMQAAALLQKVEGLVGDRWTLGKMLSNKDPHQFFEMMPSRKIARIVTDIENIKGFENVIKGLPPATLSVLLTARRTRLQGGKWTSDTLLSGGSKLALLGLTCNDIYAMETMDFIYIMEQYNRVRNALKKPFPKDLQYCSQMALMSYLEKKGSLQNFKLSEQLLDYLEPAETEAIGGYILATLPVQDIEKAINSQHMLETIGQLSLPELLVATKEIKPYKYAQLLLKKHEHPHKRVTEIKAFEISSLGNLVHFLPATDILKINPVSMKLFVESFGDSASKIVCANSVTRSAWYQIFLKAFGDPFSWTSSVLATLGDFLLVVPNEELNSVPLDSWKDAADTLVEQTSYYMKVEWPGIVDRIPLYQACAEILEDSESSNYVAAVRRLARWHLAAVQSQLNTIVSASQMLATVHQSKKEKPVRKMVIPNLPIEMKHPDTIIKVLVPDEVGKSIIVKKPGAEMELGTVAMPNTLTSESTTHPTSTVALHESNETLNADLIEKLEELETSTTGDTEANTEFLMETSTPAAESIIWSSTKSDKINKIDGDNYLTTLRSSTETVISTGSSLENTTVTLIYPPTSAAVDSNSTSVTSDINSTERSAELPTDKHVKFSANIENKHLLQEIKSESSSDSLPVNGSISLKRDENMSLSSHRSNHEKVKVKRHANVEDKEEQRNNQTINGINRAEQSGEVLRGVIRANIFSSQTKPSAVSALIPEIEMTSVQPADKREIPRYWEKVSCDAIRATGLSAGLALDETDIELMGLEELEMCVDTLGSLELDSKLQTKIWSLVNKDKLLENLSDLGHLVKVLEVDDISKINLNLSSSNALDNLATLSEMVTDTHVLHEVGSHFLKSNPDMKKLITETTVALGRILCEVLTISSQKLHDLLEHSVFLQASPMLGRMKDCPTHCLHKFVNLATRNSEYGPLDTWTAEDVATLGSTPAGLKAEQWRKLKSTGYGNNPLVGIRPSAIRCIPPQIFKELDDDQLKSLPTLSAAVVSQEQLSHLSRSQQLALTRIQKEVRILKYSEDTDSSIKQQHKPNGSASSTDINLLVIVVLAVISRFIA